MSSAAARPLVVDADGLQQIRHQQSVDDETGAVVRDHRRLPQAGDKCLAELDGCRVTQQGPDDLDPLHRRHRAEEMQSDEPVRAAGQNRHLRDAQRRGIAGKDRLVTARLVERNEHLALGIDVLGHRLDHQLARGQRREVGGPLQVPGGSVHRRLVELATLNRLGDRCSDTPQAGGQEFVVDLTDDRAVARLGDDLSDAAAHEPAADDANTIDAGHSLVGHVASRPAGKSRYPARRQCMRWRARAHHRGDAARGPPCKRCACRSCPVDAPERWHRH